MKPDVRDILKNFFNVDIFWNFHHVASDYIPPHHRLSIHAPTFCENDELHFGVFREGKLLGAGHIVESQFLEAGLTMNQLREFREFLASVFFAEDSRPGVFHQLIKLANAVHEIKRDHAQIIDWAGIYFKESYISKKLHSTDLILGPFWGAATEHVRIPLNRGMCGLALSEERVVNVPDVRQDSRHIACSLSTRSELVVPLYDRDGKAVAELDLDSNTLNAFTPKIEAEIKQRCLQLPINLG